MVVAVLAITEVEILFPKGLYDVCPHNWQMLTHNKESVYIDFFLFKANKRKLDEAHNTAEMTLKNHISANENQQLKRC